MAYFLHNFTKNQIWSTGVDMTDDVFRAVDFREAFVETMRIAMQQAREIAERHGFDSNAIEEGTSLMLMTSELGEWLEAIRHNNPASDHIPQFRAAEEEAADLLIRVFHFCATKEYRLPEAILCKMDFNATRPHKHGKSF